MVLDEETLERMLASRSRDAPAKAPTALTEATADFEVYERPTQGLGGLQGRAEGSDEIERGPAPGLSSSNQQATPAPSQAQGHQMLHTAGGQGAQVATDASQYRAPSNQDLQSGYARPPAQGGPAQPSPPPQTPMQAPSVPGRQLPSPTQPIPHPLPTHDSPQHTIPTPSPQSQHGAAQKQPQQAAAQQQPHHAQPQHAQGQPREAQHAQAQPREAQHAQAQQQPHHAQGQHLEAQQAQQVPQHVSPTQAQFPHEMAAPAEVAPPQVAAPEMGTTGPSPWPPARHDTTKRPQVFTLHPSGQGPRIAIIQADYNSDVTDRMAELARGHATEAGSEVVAHVHVPGVFDTPLAAKMAAKRDDVDAIVVLGAVVQGQTGHDELIAREAARLLADTAYHFEKPVGLGIAGPRMDMAQAEARVQMGRNAVASVVAQWQAIRA